MSEFENIVAVVVEWNKFKASLEASLVSELPESKNKKGWTLIFLRMTNIYVCARIISLYINVAKHAKQMLCLLELKLENCLW